MTVIFVDVGQGNSIFIISPSGTTLMYDAGGNPEWSTSSWDPGMEIIVPFLEKYSPGRIDYAVISHAHGDHIGGFKSVIYNFEIGLFLDPGYLHPTELYSSTLEAIKSKGISYSLVKEGDGEKIDLGPGITCRVFNPPADGYLSGTNSDCNNNSVILKVTYGNVNFLFTGDAEVEAEIYCVKKYGDELETNILQVSHHGSDTSSSQPFLGKAMPEVAVIPVNEDNNAFGHPKRQTLSSLESVGAEIFRMDYDGDITVITNGKTFIVETEK
jgi:beta-lactamase superfamily II metal-dependent hydrolase